MTHAEGDLRRSINILQSASSLFQGKPISVNEITEIAGAVPATVAENANDVYLKGSSREIISFVDDVVAEGYAINQVIQQIGSTVVRSPHMSDLQKAKASRALSIADHRLTDGAEESIQLMYVTSEIRKICQGA